MESLAKTVQNNGGVTFIPALAGLGAPYWNPNATGTIIGITRGTQKGHIARATLEAIAMRTKEIIIAMQKDANTTFKSLKVDGGGSINDLLMQIQANLLDVEVIRPDNTETTALGAAFFAAVFLFGAALRFAAAFLFGAAFLVAVFLVAFLFGAAFVVDLRLVAAFLFVAMLKSIFSLFFSG